ncbi:TonB-dependent receptor plug domain-containing protein [Sphingopyxis indica]|uniref:Outer membrane cobalamin receptor protein n=1 Tax=Sphingopyxis indica TaxID=436663 RepID=A0A239D851_9SPHN|nr:Outer membrane cobalamin receptor protein [Sphingopyxis indica]
MTVTAAFRLAPLPLTALMLLPVSAPAQEQPIIVTGTGLADTPATPAYDITLIDRDALTATASGRLEDALASVAGFQQFRRSDSRASNPSAQGITLRALGGNATSRAAMLLDGVPVADPFFGYIPFSALAPERLASVRVTRGGGSGPFGAGALAGTIELASTNAEALGPLSGTLLVDDRGESEASATLAAPLGAGFAVVSGRWDRGQGYYTTPADQRVPATARAAYDSWSAQIRLVAPLTDTVELQARAMAFDDRRTLRFEGADSSSEGQEASLRLVGRGAWQFDALAYVQARNFTNIVISSSRFTPVLDQRNTPSTGLGGKLELRPPVGGNHVLRLGLDYRRSDGELFEDALSAMTGQVTARRNAGGTNSDLGLFVEDDWSLGALTLTAGARADRYVIADGFFIERDGAGVVVADDRFAGRSGWQGSVRGGAMWQASDALRLRAAAYSGLRLPTLNELYRPFVVFPVTTLANAELRNERLVGYEAGLDLTPAKGIDLSATLFDNKVKHAVANVTIGPDLRQRRNIDAIHARGVELSAGIARGIVGFRGSAAYTDAEAQGSGPAAALDGNRPAQTPRWAASATLSLAPAPGWSLAGTLRYVGAQYEDDLESDILDAATTLDLYAEVPLAQRARLVLRAENVTDTRVMTRNQGGSIDLGTPRTLWIGVTFGK